jgi:hypothetical protein
MASPIATPAAISLMRFSIAVERGGELPQADKRKAAAKISSMAMRLCTNHVKLLASSSMANRLAARRCDRCQTSRPNAKRPSPPARTEGTRQASGWSPNNPDRGSEHFLREQRMLAVRR